MAETTDELTADVAALTARVAMIEDHLGMAPPPPPVSPPPPPVSPPPPAEPPPGEPAPHDDEQAAALALVASADLYVPVGEVRELTGAGVELLKIHVAGTLRLVPPLTLYTDTIVVNHGRIECGTPDAPVTIAEQVRIVFHDTGPLDPTADPLLIGRGIICHGQCAVYGELPPLLADGRPDPANTNRPIRIECVTPGTERGGHVMFMHKAAVTLQGVGFYGMGRTDKTRVATDPPDLANVRGRYACHFHRGGPDNPKAEVLGCIAVDGPGWHFVDHDGGVDFTDSISVRPVGAGFVTEIGGESGTVNNCLTMDVRGIVVGNLNDPAFAGMQGNGAWLQGGGPFRINGLKVDGCPGIGVVLMGTQDVDVPVSRLPDDDYADLKAWCAANNVTALPSHDVPFVYRGLDVKSNDPTGFYPWSNGNPSVHPGRALLEDSTFRQCSIVSGYSNKTDHRRVKVLGNPKAPRLCGIGHTGVVESHGYYDCEVTDWGIGLQVPSRGVNVIQGGKWGNVVDFLFLNQSDPALAGRSITVEVDESNFPPLEVDPAAFPINFNGDTLPPGRWRYACVMWFVWIHINKIKALPLDHPWLPQMFGWRETLGRDSIQVPHTVTGAPIYIHPYEVCRDYPLDGLPIRDDIRQGCATSGELYDKTGYALWGTEPVAGQAMPGLYGEWSAEPAKVIETPKIHNG